MWVGHLVQMEEGDVGSHLVRMEEGDVGRSIGADGGG